MLLLVLLSKNSREILVLRGEYVEVWCGEGKSERNTKSNQQGSQYRKLDRAQS